MNQPIKNKYDFVMLYDVENGNPNGDPDAGNMPRLDPETGHGIVTDVCIKRKIRNYIELVKGDEKGYAIYIRQDKPLNEADKVGLEAASDKKGKEQKSLSFRSAMCENYYDIRTFGAVMTTAATDKELMNVAGQVRGPVQLAFGKSVNPVVAQEITITRSAITTAADAEKKTNEMGRKHIIPYGLYRQEGFVSANLAQKITGFSEDDLQLFWKAVENMFEDDRSAARGKMVLRKLIIFKHECKLGNAPAYQLFERVNVKLKDGVTAPRAYSDYVVTVDDKDLPQGVSIEVR